NDVPLTRARLHQILQDLSARLLVAFGHQVTLIVHGGAVMVLHRDLHHRQSTQDVDYIHRAFVAQYRSPDAETRLRSCIASTAAVHGLGADWMNDHADVALPWATNPMGQRYDPITHATLSVSDNIIFQAPGLKLLMVPWSWAFALKFVRYQKEDPRDIAAMLRLGEGQKSIRWDTPTLEKWITDLCWPMGYSNYPPPLLEQLRERMRHAISLAGVARSPRHPVMYPPPATP
ncbi:hypothetical protein BV25DRAFT_1762457, partial [Artomyces pyxidatus]